MSPIKLMVLVTCLGATSCKHSYDKAKAGNEILADKATGAQPIVNSSDLENKGGMQPIAPFTQPPTTGMQPIAPRTNSETSSSTSTSTTNNPDGSTTTTTTTVTDTTTTTIVTTPVPSDDPPSIAVTRSATADEAKVKGCPAVALAMDQGMDTNRNSLLDPTEIMQTTVECQASTGSDGKAPSYYSPDQN